MKGLKFLASCAAVGALAVTCATASFADAYTATVNTDNLESDGTITITIPDEYVTLVGGDLTLLVLSENATSITNENSSIVKQIQQGDSTILTDVKVGTDLTAGATYYVRVGGAEASDEDGVNPDGFIAGTFTVPNPEDDSPYTDPTHKVGDVNGSTTLDTGDVTDLVYYFAGKYTLTGDNYQAADVNDSGTVDTGDVTDLVYYFADKFDLPSETLEGKTNVVEVE